MRYLAGIEIYHKISGKETITIGMIKFILFAYKVCKNALASLCFNDLWKHTKYDHEGECKRRHDHVFLSEFKSDKGFYKLKREKLFIE